MRREILRLAKETYRDYNDCHFTEELAEQAEPIVISRSTLRRIRRAAGQGSPRKRRAPEYRGRRERYPQTGMMLQTDGSRHDWLEGRGPWLTLVGMFDLAWSTNSDRIAFISDYAGDPEVYVIDTDGTNLAQVTKSVARAGIHVNSSPTWSPNGAYIAYISIRNEKTGIYIARVDGTGEWLVIETPAWAHSLYWGLLPGLSEP